MDQYLSWWAQQPNFSSVQSIIFGWCSSRFHLHWERLMSGGNWPFLQSPRAAGSLLGWAWLQNFKFKLEVHEVSGIKSNPGQGSPVSVNTEPGSSKVPFWQIEVGLDCGFSLQASPGWALNFCKTVYEVCQTKKHIVSSKTCQPAC